MHSPQIPQTFSATWCLRFLHAAGAQVSDKKRQKQDASDWIALLRKKHGAVLVQLGKPVQGRKPPKGMEVEAFVALFKE